jgi:hypothetical protein
VSASHTLEAHSRHVLTFHCHVVWKRKPSLSNSVKMRENAGKVLLVVKSSTST